jgi:type IV secretory pathway TraG/TraD family ATPase VirD4
MVLKKNRQLILVENLNPIAGEKVIWYDDKKLGSLGISLK